jgi:hypothetical protein
MNLLDGHLSYSYSLPISFIESSIDLVDLMFPQQDYSLLFIHLLVASMMEEMFSSLAPPFTAYSKRTFLETGKVASGSWTLGYS